MRNESRIALFNDSVSCKEENRLLLHSSVDSEEVLRCGENDEDGGSALAAWFAKDFICLTMSVWWCIEANLSELDMFN